MNNRVLAKRVDCDCPTALGRWTHHSSRFLDWLICFEVLAGISTCVCNETKKFGDSFELGLAVPRANLVHQGEHRRVKTRYLACPCAQRLDEDRAPIGTVPFTDDPLAPFQSIENPRRGRGM